MKILCIGNSFSCDATRYLYGIARAGGVEMEIANLYIGGCSLERHYRNMLGDKQDYQLYFNGAATGFFVTLSEALLSRQWDIITMQQASPSSFNQDTYEPYATAIADFVRECAPKAKLIVHQTWAYEDGSDKLFKVAGYQTSAAMFADVEKAYNMMAQTINADGLIPSGRVMQMLLEKGIPTVHRDTFHANLGVGRYALGLLWYRMLTGKSAAENSFRDFDIPVSEEEILIAKACVDSIDLIF